MFKVLTLDDLNLLPSSIFGMKNWLVRFCIHEFPKTSLLSIATIYLFL